MKSMDKLIISYEFDKRQDSLSPSSSLNRAESQQSASNIAVVTKGIQENVSSEAQSSSSQKSTDQLKKKQATLKQRLNNLSIGDLFQSPPPNNDKDDKVRKNVEDQKISANLGKQKTMHQSKSKSKSKRQKSKKQQLDKQYQKKRNPLLAINSSSSSSSGGSSLQTDSEFETKMLQQFEQDKKVLEEIKRNQEDEKKNTMKLEEIKLNFAKKLEDNEQGIESSVSESDSDLKNLVNVKGGHVQTRVEKLFEKFSEQLEEQLKQKTKAVENTTYFKYQMKIRNQTHTAQVKKGGPVTAPRIETVTLSLSPRVAAKIKDQVIKSKLDLISAADSQAAFKLRTPLIASPSNTTNQMQSKGQDNALQQEQNKLQQQEIVKVQTAEDQKTQLTPLEILVKKGIKLTVKQKFALERINKQKEAKRKMEEKIQRAQAEQKKREAQAKLKQLSKGVNKDRIKSMLEGIQNKLGLSHKTMAQHANKFQACMGMFRQLITFFDIQDFIKALNEQFYLPEVVQKKEAVLKDNEKTYAQKLLDLQVQHKSEWKPKKGRFYAFEKLYKGNKYELLRQSILKLAKLRLFHNPSNFTAADFQEEEDQKAKCQVQSAGVMKSLANKNIFSKAKIVQQVAEKVQDLNEEFIQEPNTFQDVIYENLTCTQKRRKEARHLAHLPIDLGKINLPSQLSQNEQYNQESQQQFLNAANIKSKSRKDKQRLDFHFKKQCDELSTELQQRILRTEDENRPSLLQQSFEQDGDDGNQTNFDQKLLQMIKEKKFEENDDHQEQLYYNKLMTKRRNCVYQYSGAEESIRKKYMINTITEAAPVNPLQERKLLKSDTAESKSDEENEHSSQIGKSQESENGNDKKQQIKFKEIEEQRLKSINKNKNKAKKTAITKLSTAEMLNEILADEEEKMEESKEQLADEAMSEKEDVTNPEYLKSYNEKVFIACQLLNVALAKIYKLQLDNYNSHVGGEPALNKKSINKQKSTIFCQQQQQQENQEKTIIQRRKKPETNCIQSTDGLFVTQHQQQQQQSTSNIKQKLNQQESLDTVSKQIQHMEKHSFGQMFTAVAPTKQYAFKSNLLSPQQLTTTTSNDSFSKRDSVYKTPLSKNEPVGPVVSLTQEEIHNLQLLTQQQLQQQQQQHAKNNMGSIYSKGSKATTILQKQERSLQMPKNSYQRFKAMREEQLRRKFISVDVNRMDKRIGAFSTVSSSQTTRNDGTTINASTVVSQFMPNSTASSNFKFSKANMHMRTSSLKNMQDNIKIKEKQRLIMPVKLRHIDDYSKHMSQEVQPSPPSISQTQMQEKLQQELMTINDQNKILRENRMLNRADNQKLQALMTDLDIVEATCRMQKTHTEQQINQLQESYRKETEFYPPLKLYSIRQKQF